MRFWSYFLNNTRGAAAAPPQTGAVNTDVKELLEEVHLKIMPATWGLPCWKALESSSRVRHTKMHSDEFEPSGYWFQNLIEDTKKSQKSQN